MKLSSKGETEMHLLILSLLVTFFLRSFDTVAWVSGRAHKPQNLSDKMLVIQLE